MATKLRFPGEAVSEPIPDEREVAPPKQKELTLSGILIEGHSECLNPRLALLSIAYRSVAGTLTEADFRVFAEELELEAYDKEEVDTAYGMPDESLRTAVKIVPDLREDDRYYLFLFPRDKEGEVLLFFRGSDEARELGSLAQNAHEIFTDLFIKKSGS